MLAGRKFRHPRIHYGIRAAGSQRRDGVGVVTVVPLAQAPVAYPALRWRVAANGLEWW